MDSPTNHAHKRRRPVGIIILVVLLFLYAVLLTVSIFVEEVYVSTWVLPQDAATAAIVISLVIAIGLWLLRRWAWIALMLWTGLTLSVALLAYVRGDRPYITMIGAVIVVFYLNQREVQDAFRDQPPVEEAQPEP